MGGCQTKKTMIMYRRKRQLGKHEQESKVNNNSMDEKKRNQSFFLLNYIELGATRGVHVYREDSQTPICNIVVAFCKS